MFNTTSVEQIMATTNRIPYSVTECEIALATAKKRRSQMHDLLIGDPVWAPDTPSFLEGAEQGVLFFHSPVMLGARFLFVKLNAGKGLFGGQKSVYANYLAGEPEDEEWAVGTVFKTWAMAVTSIGNVYRGSGF